MKNKSGFIVAAAFIGPGTVTTASIAGAQTGMHLAWALMFSVFATCVLQDMIVRLSTATGHSLSHNIRAVFNHKAVKQCISLLIFIAIGIGNAAYQSGNITGAAIGVSNVLPGPTQYWALVIGGIAALLILLGNQTWLERILVGLVALMSLFFIATLLLAGPDWTALFEQIFTPQWEANQLGLVLALIGTTVVPYNLFLQASLVIHQQASPSTQNVLKMRKDNALAIMFGGAVSLSIMLTATMTFFGSSQQLDSSNIGQQLTPLLGQHAGLFFAIGLFAAGLTSAMTAPLAAGYAICSIMGWQNSTSGRGFRGIALTIIVLGIAFASTGIKPLSLIVIAQATNAVLLPFLIAVILWVMWRSNNLKHQKNNLFFNLAGLFILVTIIALSSYKLWSVF